MGHQEAPMPELKAAVIVASNRVKEGTKPNKAGQRAVELLTNHGVEVTQKQCLNEGAANLRPALSQVIEAGTDVVLVIGATGISRDNDTPEVTEEFIAARMWGLETQVLLEGLKNSPRAGLCRGIIGVTSCPPGTLLVNSASSVGAVEDTLAVVLPLLKDIFRECR
ncbi:bifunctional molybdenum cofactor biosynthesis protein MoaC/MogA [Corynebacterium confusum]|nr:bifunctional molybdenum cofactor biosynthesis protein MoaC/MogA [Corynebacterium confusum]